MKRDKYGRIIRIFEILPYVIGFMKKYILPIDLLITGFSMVLYGWLFPYLFFPCHDTHSPCEYNRTLPILIPDLGYFVMAAGGIWMAIISRTKKYVLPVSILVVGFAMVVYGWIDPYIPAYCTTNPCLVDQTPSYFTGFFGYFVLITGGILMAIKRRKKISAKSI